jgi:predicted nucleotidyltransferase
MFESVLASLADFGVPFVVTGGWAVRFHGYEERPVEDLDIVVDRTPAEANRMMQCLMQLGFFPTIPLHLTQAVVMTFMDQESRRLDVNAMYQPPFPQLLEQATSREVLGRRVAVISLPDLLDVKRRRGRPYDLADVEELVRLHPPAE